MEADNTNRVKSPAQIWKNEKHLWVNGGHNVESGSPKTGTSVFGFGAISVCVGWRLWLCRSSTVRHQFEVGRTSTVEVVLGCSANKHLEELQHGGHVAPVVQPGFELHVLIGWGSSGIFESNRRISSSKSVVKNGHRMLCC